MPSTQPGLTPTDTSQAAPCSGDTPAGAAWEVARPAWQRKPVPPPDAVAHLLEALQLNDTPAIPYLLAQRGLTQLADAQAFFQPLGAPEVDPMLLPDMQVAIERLGLAAQRDELVMVYGDYDVDGTTAVALFTRFLEAMGVRYLPYVPDRYTEGYGVSEAGMQLAIQQGVGLLITLDCGVRAVERLAEACAAGIDVIICDHHKPGSTRPAALALIDPVLPESAYPNPHLTGCGVAYKLACATAVALDIPYDPTDGLDLLALSLCCDIVPLVGENRTLVAKGLQKLSSSPQPGLASLMAQSRTARQWDVNDLVFFLGPRLNAAGRMGHALDAVRLLKGEDSLLAERASQLDAQNNARREQEQRTAEQAEQLLAAFDGSDPVIVLAHPAWSKGIVGIVASKLVERYHRPTVLLAPKDGPRSADDDQPVAAWVGSGRSVSGVDLHAALVATEHRLVRYGGHTHAAGLELVAEQLPEWRAEFAAAIAAHWQDEQRQPQLWVDGELSLAEITPKLVRLIDRMGPFGPGHRRPRFWLEPVTITHAWAVGGHHARLVLRQGNTERHAIAFQLAERIPGLQETPYRVAAIPEFNHFNGKTSLQLRVLDWQPV